MSQITVARRRQQKTWQEVVWDTLAGVFVQILFAIIDGVVVRLKNEVLKSFGRESDWRTQYR
jgi:hypothetical protein